MEKAFYPSQVLTNATNVGMAPYEDECLIRDPSVFPYRPGCLRHYFINPRETKLMRLAQRAGLPRHLTCLYMLLYQGAESFRLWTGQDMPVEPIKEKYFT